MQETYVALIDVTLCLTCHFVVSLLMMLPHHKRKLSKFGGGEESLN